MKSVRLKGLGQRTRTSGYLALAYLGAMRETDPGRLALPGIRSDRAMLPVENAPLFCDRCSKALRRGEGRFYVIKIDAVADPSPPVIADPNIPEDLPGEIDRLLKQVSAMTEQELMDQVHRRVVLYLCTRCYRVWIEEPVRRV
jgi:hypothetical protein